MNIHQFSKAQKVPFGEYRGLPRNELAQELARDAEVRSGLVGDALFFWDVASCARTLPLKLCIERHGATTMAAQYVLALVA